MNSRTRTLPEALDEAARSREGFVFLKDGVERRCSYAELRQRAMRMASALVGSGIRPGDLVAVTIEDAEALLTALLGAAIARAVPALLAPPAITADLSAYLEVTAPVVRAAGARAIVASARLVSGLDALRATCPALEFVAPHEDLDAPPRRVAELPSADEIALVQYTSGSTSAPKGVALTHANLCANIDAINGAAGLAVTGADSAVSWLPLYHDMGLIGMALGPLYASRPAVLMTPYAFVKRPADWLKAISDYRATVSFAPNFAYDLVVRRIHDRDLEGLDLSRWRIAGCGAEPIHAPTFAAFADRLTGTGFRPTSFFPCYGLAEHVLAATLPLRSRAPRVEGSLVGCGRALPGHRLRIVNPHGVEAAEGELGEITLAGPSVMSGYYNDAASTAETVRQGWLHTGDLGYLRDGDLFVCGRMKDTIIANGRKFHPEDLEWALADLDELQRQGRAVRTVAFGVSAHQDAAAADLIVIVVETGRAQPFEPLAQAIRRRIGDVFGLTVADIVAAPSGTIERTTSGKVRRAAARTWYARQRGL